MSKNRKAQSHLFTAGIFCKGRGFYVGFYARKQVGIQSFTYVFEASMSYRRKPKAQAIQD